MSMNILCEGFAFALQQIVACLGALQFALHQSQRLTRGEDSLPGLRVMSVLLPHSFIGGATYPAARHGERVGRPAAARRISGEEFGGGRRRSSGCLVYAIDRAARCECWLWTVSMMDGGAAA
jgi:hypothetical protein